MIIISVSLASYTLHFQYQTSVINIIMKFTWSVRYKEERSKVQEEEEGVLSFHNRGSKQTSVNPENNIILFQYVFNASSLAKVF